MIRNFIHEHTVRLPIGKLLMAAIVFYFFKSLMDYVLVNLVGSMLVR